MSAPDRSTGSEHFDVAVVGAGLAGLSAARALKRAGVTAIVLEARERVGGRTLSERAGAGVFDLGAQWLGPTQLRMHALVRELGVETFPTFHEGRKVLEVDGRRSTYAGSIPKLSPINLALLQRTISTVDRRARNISVEEPWSSDGASTLDAQTLESWKRRQIPSRAVRQVFDVAARVVFGAEPAELSLLHFLFYVRSAGGLMDLIEIEGGAQETRFAGGAQEVAKMLAAELGDAVITGAAVRTIETTRDGVMIEAGSTGGASARWRAGRVIVAVPPPLAGRIEYRPAHSGLRDGLTQRFPMGATIKAHLLYDDAFWRRNGLSGEAVITRGPVSVFFDNGSADGRQPALLGFIVGSAARHLGLRDEDVRRGEVVRAAVSCFGKQAGEPVAYLEKDWSADPWTRGCPTASLPPGALTDHGVALREPVGSIHWAGTETSPIWTGYMEGAVVSGERAAAEVLSRL